MQELKKINVLSVLRISVLFGLLMGIVLTIIYATIPQELFVALNPSQVKFTLSFGALTILGQAAGMAIFGVITAALYNLFTKWIGGIKLDLADVKTTSKKK